MRAFQVAPPELEGVLLDHPDIVDAAVIGVPDPNNSEGSELPRAYLVRREGGKSPSEQDVNGWMKERLASYKQLMGGINFVQEIPKVSLRFLETYRGSYGLAIDLMLTSRQNASGKILKRILRDQAKKEMGAKL